MHPPARLRRDPMDPEERLHCSRPECWAARSPFRLGEHEVSLRLIASHMMLAVMPDRSQAEFRKGHVEVLRCANCGTAYFPTSAYDPA